MTGVKLTQLRPLIGRLPPMLGPAPGDEKERNRYRADREPWHAWYQTARWKRLRVFIRDIYSCQECGRIEANTAKLVAHHAKPHRGDEALFWDEACNIVTVCMPVEVRGAFNSFSYNLGNAAYCKSTAAKYLTGNRSANVAPARKL